jgi:hypothetical protein
VLNTEPEPFASINIAVPAGLELVVRRALSKPRDGRYATAMELYEALGPYSSDNAGSVSGTTQRAALPTRSMSLEHAGAVTPVSVSAPPAPTAHKRGLPIAVLLLLLIGAAGLAAFLSRRASNESPTPGPSTADLADASAPTGAVPRPPERVETALAPEVVAEAVANDASAAGSKVEPQPTPPTGNQPGADAKVESPEPRRSRDRSRSAKESPLPPPPPAPEPRVAPRPEPSDENVSNFGGRR